MNLEKRLELLENRQKEIESKLNEILEVWDLIDGHDTLEFSNMSEDDEKSLREFMEGYFNGNSNSEDCIGAPC